MIASVTPGPQIPWPTPPVTWNRGVREYSFIILIARSVNFMGEGLRDAFDPRTKRIPSEREMARTLIKANRAATGGAA